MNGNNKKAYSGASLLLFQDGALSCTASLLSVLLVRWLSDPISGFTGLVLKWIGVGLVATCAGTFLSGSYKVVRRWTTLHSSWRIIQTLLIKEIMMALALVFGLVRMPTTTLAVLAVMSDGVFTALLLFYIRYAARLFSREDVSQVKAVSTRKNALIAGTEADAVSLAQEVSREYNVVGFLSGDESMNGRVIWDIVVYSVTNQEELEQLEWRLGGIDCIFFPKSATGSFGHPSNNTKDVSIPDGMSGFGRFFKRSFDVLASAVLLILFSPLGLLSAVAVKLEDGGPVFYKQERVGKGGKSFYILKFRSMRVDAEASGAQLYSGEGDPRLTRVGAFLRGHHLDELPQLWNVLRGDMSFIGYRPERPVFISQIMEKNPRYRYLYQIRPGVTSYATLYNGYTDTLEKMLTRLDLDLYYLRNHSVLFDVKVLGLTFLSIVSGKKF